MQKSTIFPEIKTGCWICFLLLLASPDISCQLAGGFEDGVLSIASGSAGGKMEQMPPERWGIDSLHPISGSYSLHHSHDNSEAGCDYFLIHHGPFTRSRTGDSFFTGDSLSFSFRLRHGYPPSSGNNWQLAILADFDGAIEEGIILGVNLEGSDDLVKIWRAQDGELEELCSSELNYQEENGKDSASLFSLSWQWDGRLVLCYSSDGQKELRQIAACALHELTEGRSMVVRYKYSSAQDRKLWIDDLLLEGSFRADTTKPRVNSWSVDKENCIRLVFSEVLRSSDSARAVISMPGALEGQSASYVINADSLSLEEMSLLLFFPDPLPNREELDLLVSGFYDRDGNCMEDTLLKIKRNEAEWGDLVINELLFDPDPEVGISLGEYVEFFNRSGYEINPEGWVLEVGERKYELWGEGREKLLAPGDFLLLAGISLPNKGSLLSLYGRDEELIHAAAYGIPYGEPKWKKDGGWSLESPDSDRVCSTSQLWEYSKDDSGGTPGRVNSVDGKRADYQEPVFLYYGFGEQGDLWLHFSESLVVSENLAAQVNLSPGNIPAMDLRASGPLSETLICHFRVDPSLYSRFTCRMPAVSDCQGNLLEEFSFNGGPSKKPVPGAVIINEIMYDPLEGSAEYIEIYNPGQDFVDLRDLGLGLSGEEEAFEKLLPLSDFSRIIGPDEYLVLSACTLHLRDSYNLEISGSWVEMEGFMSLPDGGGKIWLTDRSGNSIDVVSYGDEMHMELIGDSRGISLERIDPLKSGSGMLANNWHSAASIEGYASPGRKNSQALPVSDPGEGLRTEPGVFSPDNDGFEDLLLISPGVEESGTVIHLWITTPEGRVVRRLANNHVAGLSSQYVWDGRDDTGGMASEGFYLVHLRTYDPLTGQSGRNQKLAVGLIYR